MYKACGFILEFNGRLLMVLSMLTVNYHLQYVAGLIKILSWLTMN